MKVSVSFSCEVDIEIDERFRALCKVCDNNEEAIAADELTDEMVDEIENQLSDVGFNVYSIDSVETYDGWLLYEDD